MDAIGLKKSVCLAILGFVVGCAERRYELQPGPIPDWMSPLQSDSSAPPTKGEPPTHARGQSPDAPSGPIAPIGPLDVKPLPDPLAPTSDLVVPTTPITPPIVPNTVVSPASVVAPPSSASTLTPPSVADALREKQIQVAAYIGAETVITDDEVWQMVRQRAGDYIELFGSEKEAKEKEIYRDELKKLIERELVILELFTRMKKNKAEDKIDGLLEYARDTANRRMVDFRKSRGIPNEEEFNKLLRSQGLSFKGIRRQIERDALVGVYFEQMLKDKNRFVTLNDMWDYYLANPKEFTIDESVKWLDLFISVQRFNTPAEAKQYAEQIWRAAQSGTDFIELVKTYSHGDSVLRNGEGIGAKRGEIQPSELEPVLFQLQPGQLSPLLQTATGYHIVKLVEMQKQGLKPFDAKVQTEIRNKLTRQLQEREVAAMMDKLWRTHRPRVVGQ